MVAPDRFVLCVHAAASAGSLGWDRMANGPWKGSNCDEMLYGKGIE